MNPKQTALYDSEDKSLVNMILKVGNDGKISSMYAKGNSRSIIHIYNALSQPVDIKAFRCPYCHDTMMESTSMIATDSDEKIKSGPGHYCPNCGIFVFEGGQ